MQLEPRLLEEIDDLEGDGGGARNARRVDARRVDELRLGGALLEDPVAAARLGARAWLGLGLGRVRVRVRVRVGLGLDLARAPG